jgi:hypothetical protein
MVVGHEAVRDGMAMFGRIDAFTLAFSARAVQAAGVWALLYIRRTSLALAVNLVADDRDRVHLGIRRSRARPGRGRCRESGMHPRPGPSPPADRAGSGLRRSTSLLYRGAVHAPAATVDHVHSAYALDACGKIQGRHLGQ